MKTSEEKKKILIVEDELSMLRILLDTFRRENFETSEARDGKNALKKALKEKPDIILLDILLPEMDGISVLKRLREKNKYGKNVPVILLTNLSPDREEINKVIAEHDTAYYLIKTNWNIEDIVEKVKKSLAKPVKS